MTKLIDLSEQELADLLGTPLDKARKWLEVARSISGLAHAKIPSEYREFLLLNLETSSLLQRSAVGELMHLSVEEVERLKKTGELYRRFPYLRKRRVPEDAETRLRYLRDLLSDEGEFETRYPAAYEVLFQDSAASSGLRLPSFDTRVMRSEPTDTVLPAGWSQELKLARDSGDAFSATFERRISESERVNRALAPPALGYMRGVLLAILSREEYAERIATELHYEAIREELVAPAQASVRLTDLRLAANFEPKDVNLLEKELRPLLLSLERPITPDRVFAWKWKLLHEDGATRILRVSFAAAALLLLLDFDIPDLENASDFRLAHEIARLAEIVRKLSRAFDRSARELEELLAYRPQNRPLTHGQEFYDALVDYRMGTNASEVARNLGMTPYKSSPSEPGGDDAGGTKQWKQRLKEKLERGAKTEKSEYLLASAVLAHRAKTRTQDKAKLAYRAYREEVFLSPEELSWWRIGNEIHVDASTIQGLEVVKGYVQLGSCLEHDLDPYPTRSDFRL